MRKKTDAMRQAILDVAADVFRQQGFEGAKMSDISKRLSGSKATLYNYFASKDELFFEVMTRSSDTEFEAVYRSLDGADEDIETALHRFGERYLGTLYSPEVQATRHLSIAQAGRTDLGKLMYEKRVLQSRHFVADLLRHAMTQGQLRADDPVVATRHLHALLESELIDCFLFQIEQDVAPEALRTVTARAIRVFMAAYGPPAASSVTTR